MMTRMKAFLVTTASAVAVALLALPWLGEARSVRAEHSEVLAAARPDTVLISTAALDGLEQRVSYLEGVVASLTLSSQHIRAYQVCISGDSSPDTCITKPQLDALLASQPMAHAGGASVSNEVPKTEPEFTGSISTPAAPAKAE